MNDVYRLGDVEEALSEMEELADIEDRVIEQGEEHLISATGYSVTVPSLGLNLHEGMFYVASESAGGGDADPEWEADFSLTAVYDESDDEVLYWEQDGFAITLANYLHGKSELTLQEIEDLECRIVIPRE